MPQFFWKYRCMKAHWQRQHSSITMPVSLVTDLEIDGLELSSLKSFKSASVKSRSKKQSAAASVAK